MTFDVAQVEALKAKLDGTNVKERKQGGRTVSYIEGWKAIEEANRIFGFEYWTRETTIIECVADAAREIGEAKVPGFGVSYICKVRVTVFDQEFRCIVREGCGAGHGIDRDHGQAHESAIKEAETDAMKRALMTFGNPFGLALYDKAQANVTDDEPPPQHRPETEAEIAARQRYLEGCKGTIESMNGNYQMLLTWWNSDVQKATRRKYNLSSGEVELLKALVLSKKPEGTNED